MDWDEDLLRQLEEFGHVLTPRLIAEPGPIAHARDEEVERIASHVLKADQNSLVVVGPSGCGKTAVLHEVFRRIGQLDDEPWLVLETSSMLLLAGTSYIGEWQTRVNELLQTASRFKRIACYFTDLQNLGTAGRTSNSDQNMAHLIAPVVNRGEFTVIGECTPRAFRAGIERIPDLQQSMTVFHLEPPPPAAVSTIVEHAAAEVQAGLERDSDLEVAFPNRTLRVIEELGTLYFPADGVPAGPIKLLNQLALQLQEENTGAAEEPPGKTEVASSVLQRREVEPADVIQSLESTTGIPGHLLDDTQPLKLNKLNEFFESRVIGQPDAIHAVQDLITLIKAGLNDPQKPMGVLFFVGPTGVGKTELAKALAEFIFGSSDRMFRYDMSEFKDYHSFEKLIGGSSIQENTSLTSSNLLAKVRQQPFSVILLDEIEKAHPNIFDVLLQLFDDGRLSDSAGNTTNFTQTILIMTSNLGGDLTEAPFGFQRDDGPTVETGPPAALEEFFRPEFLNRIDRIVRFRALDREHVRILAQRELGQVLLRSGITRRGLRVDVDPGVIDVLAREGFSTLYGARPLKRAVEKYALLPIARQIVSMSGEQRQAVLRLLPSGRGIQVRIVEDRTSRKQKSIARGVPVVDPVSGNREKLKPQQIEERITGLFDTVKRLQRICDDERLEEQKTELVANTSAVNFWDDPRKARRTLSEIYRLERLLEAVQRVRRRSSDLQDCFERARLKSHAERLSTVAERSVEVQQYAELVEFSLQCRDELDRGDAIVAVSAVDQNFDEDFVGNLAGMYLSWAKLKGFSTTVIHESLQSEKVTGEAVLLIEGVAVRGMLQDEEGLHEFISGRTENQRKLSRYVSVRVLPVPDADAANLSPTDIEIQQKKARGPGLIFARHRSEVSAIHKPSQVSVQAVSDRTLNSETDVVRDWLLAELLRRRPDLFPEFSSATQTQQHEQTQEPEQTVRRYTMRPQQSARDNRTGVVVHNLQALWKGEIDEFLHAALARRTQQAASVSESGSTSP